MLRSVIRIDFEEPTNSDITKLVQQEIQETIDGLKNSLLSQVSGLSVNIIEE